MLFSRRNYLAAAIACSISPAMANDAAADKDIEVIVVTASGFEQKLVDAPASISVITREELSSRPYTTLLDAVRDLEGVDIGETRDKTGQGTISMRGMGSDYTLILIDGRRQNNNGDLYPNNFGGNQFNHIPPLDVIERLEIIRGPASTLYGADALGGVINIITRKVTDKTSVSITHGRTFEESSEFGNDTTTDFSVITPLIAGKLGLGLRGSKYDRDASNPNYAPAIDPAGTVHERTLGFGGGGRTVDNTNWSLGGRLSFTPTENHDFVFDYDTSKQKYDNSEAQLGTLDSIASLWRAGLVNPSADGKACSGNSPSDNCVYVTQPRVGYTEQQRFTREQWSLQHIGRWDFGRSDISLSYVETDNLGRSMPLTVEERSELLGLWNAGCTATFTNAAGVESCRTSNRNNLSAEQTAALDAFLPRELRTIKSSQYTLDAKLDIPIDAHKVVVGAQIIDGEMEDGVFGMYGGNFQNGVVQKHDIWALFAEDNWDITNSFTLTAGIRYDDHNVFGSHTSPRLYGVYTINPSWTIKGGVATGYKTPKTSDLFPGITGFGGQGVNPMVGTPDLQPETSVNTELAVYYSHDDGHNFNVTVFNNRFDDKIASGDSVPGCNIAAPGEYCVDLGDGWDGLGFTRFSQKYNIDRVDVKGAEVAGRYELPYGLSLRANYTYTDSEQKSGAQKGLPLTQTAKHMANATVNWKVTDDISVFLTAELRSKRYRGFDSENNKELYYKDYEVFHLGAVYQITDYLRVNARINNLFDNDFTSYQTTFSQNVDGTYSATFTDDYNNKDKARNLWVGVNLQF